MQGAWSTTGASAYGSTPRTSGASSRPPPCRASPSNIADVDENKDNVDGDGDGAEAPVTLTSARRCRSVASAPPDRVDHWHLSRRQTTGSRRTPEVRKAKEAPHRKEAKQVRTTSKCPGGNSHHGSTIRGEEGRTPPRTNRHGSTNHGGGSRTPSTTNHGSTNHGCPTPRKRKLPLEQTSPIPTSNKIMTMTPTNREPTMVVPTMMAMRTVRTPQRVGRLHGPATIPFVDKNRCGSHIIWSNTNMRTRLSTNSSTSAHWE